MLNLPNVAKISKQFGKKKGRNIEIAELRTGVHWVDLGEIFQTHISCKIRSEDTSIIHPNFAAVPNVAKPVAQLDAHSVSSTSK